MPENFDPADIILKDPNQWQSLVQNAKIIHDFYFDSALSKYDKNTVEGKQGISKIILPIIKRIPNKIEQTLWVKSLVNILNVKEEDVLIELRKVKAEQRDFAPLSEPASAVPVVQLKPRKELLEEHLAALLIRCPQFLDSIKDEDKRFFSDKFVKITECLRRGNLDNFDQSSKEFSDLISYLSLKAEVMETSPGYKPESEMQCCLREIKNLEIRNKLDAISREIKKAEEEKDQIKIQKLIEEFNLCSKSRSDLEIA